MKATLKFRLRNQAQEFTIKWSRHTLRGYSMSSGTEGVTVTVYDVTPDERLWIDQYVSNLNEAPEVETAKDIKNDFSDFFNLDDQELLSELGL